MGISPPRFGGVVLPAYNDPMSQLTREQLLQELQTSQNQIVTLLETMADVQDWQPEPAEWSFRFIAAHLATVEQKCYLHRVLRIASGETPLLTHYENQATGFARMDLHASLRRWIATRRELLDFVAAVPDRDLTLVGIHEMVGPMTLLDTLEEILDQDQGNLRHVYQLITAYYEEALKNRV